MEGRPDFGGRWPSGEASGQKNKRKIIAESSIALREFAKSTQILQLQRYIRTHHIGEKLSGDLKFHAHNYN